jgi:hypothetical protein
MFRTSRRPRTSPRPLVRRDRHHPLSFVLSMNGGGECGLYYCFGLCRLIALDVAPSCSECCGARDTPGWRACRDHRWRACSHTHAGASEHASRCRDRRRRPTVRSCERSRAGREMRELRRYQRESAQSPFMFVSESGAPLSAALYRAGAAAVQGNFSRLMRAPVSFVACD